jgi:uncharacterized protein
MSTALITGASSGIGEVFARELAAKQYDLVLVARRQEKLERLAAELTERYQIRVEVIPQDLSVPEAAATVYQTTLAKNWSIDLLINNAGFGDFGEFTQADRQKVLNMIQLNIAALVDLTYQFLPQMQQRGKGSIINVASIAAFQPMPYLAVYAATKAFVLSFSEALWAENQDKDIKVLALCPGPTQTEFFAVSQFPDSNTNSPDYMRMATSEEVVRDALIALEAGVSHVVTGGLTNKMITSVSRFLPRQSIVQLIAKQFAPK